MSYINNGGTGGGGGGTPAPPQFSIQFNNPLGTFAGTSDFTYDPTAKVPSVAGLDSGASPPSFSGALTNVHSDANGKLCFTIMSTTFAGLPASPQNGMVVTVTDAVVINPGSIVSSGGGTNNVLAYYDQPSGHWVTFTTQPAFQGRVILQANTSYYVSTSTGNDSTGDGTSANPWQTITHANQFLQDHIDFGGHRVDLILKTPDTYVGCTTMGGYVGGGALSIHGATNVPSSYVIVDNALGAFACLMFTNDTTTLIRIDNVTLKQVSNYNDSIWVDCRANVTVAGNWGDGLGQHVIQDYSNDVTNANGWMASGGGVVRIDGTVDVIVPPTRNVFTYIGSMGEEDNNSGATFVEHSVGTLTFSNNLRLGQFLLCDTQSMLIYDGAVPTFTTGACIAGHQLHVETGGIINTFGNQFFPGYLLGVDAGLVNSGGQIL